MRISSNTPVDSAQQSKPVGTANTENTAHAARPSPRSGAGELRSGVLLPAIEAMKEMPEIDQARVVELRDALARGEIAFDPQKLARLITKFHGGQS